MMIAVKRVGDHHNPAPTRAEPGSAGFDLITTKQVSLSNARQVVPTGFAWEIPSGCVGIIKERSGLAKEGVSVHGGVIDSSYRGEVKVILSYPNVFGRHKEITTGTRVAQLLIVPALHLSTIEVDCLEESARGESGFGSTGND